jgi:myosin heavy subunit
MADPISPIASVSGNLSGSLRRKAGTGNKLTVCKRFQFNLMELVATLEESNRHYVRCIKPNSLNQSQNWMATKVLSQLRSNGVMETVALR